MGETSRGIKVDTSLLTSTSGSSSLEKIFSTKDLSYTGYPFRKCSARETMAALLTRGLWSSKAPIRKLELRLLGYFPNNLAAPTLSPCSPCLKSISAFLMVSNCEDLFGGRGTDWLESLAFVSGDSRGLNKGGGANGT
jgi:hypothetical protein